MCRTWRVTGFVLRQRRKVSEGMLIAGSTCNSVPLLQRIQPHNTQARTSTLQHVDTHGVGSCKSFSCDGESRRREIDLVTPVKTSRVTSADLTDLFPQQTCEWYWHWLGSNSNNSRTRESQRIFMTLFNRFPNGSRKRFFFHPPASLPLVFLDIDLRPPGSQSRSSAGSTMSLIQTWPLVRANSSQHDPPPTSH